MIHHHLIMQCTEWVLGLLLACLQLFSLIPWMWSGQNLLYNLRPLNCIKVILQITFSELLQLGLSQFLLQSLFMYVRTYVVIELGVHLTMSFPSYRTILF